MNDELTRLTSHDQELRAAVRRYVAEDVIPNRRRFDSVRKPGDFPWELVQRGFDLGLKSLPFPTEYGGAGAGASTLAMVVEELAVGDLGVAYFFKHNWRFAQLSKRLPERLKGQTIRRICEDPTFLPATAITELGSGSDNHVQSDDPSRGVQLAAVRTGGEWVLNGSKLMITNAGMAGIYFVAARTNSTVPARQGVTMFAVPADLPGISLGDPYEKVGQRASIQCDVHFTDVRVPEDAAVSDIGAAMGEVRKGATILSNLVNAAMSIGVARSAYEESLRWATTRVQGGEPIYRHQAVARELGYMKSVIEAARAYAHAGAELHDRLGRDMDESFAYGANVFASEMVLRVSRLAVEIYGGRGMMGEWPVEKIARDAMTLQHGFGTNPLMLIGIGTAAGDEWVRSPDKAQGAKS